MASQVNDSDGGSSMTPSEQSEGDDRSERDSDYETDNGEEEENDCRDKDLNIIWTGYAKRIPVVLFNVSSVLQKHLNFKIVGERYHLAFKFGATECKIIRNILTAHGFHEVHPGCPDYNLLWTNSHLKPFTLRSMTEFQKINHFPRSYELTRKDRLYKNIQRMQQIKGVKHFDFVPQSFILPGEFQDFCSQFLKDRGPWIVKPVASSRGRGVFLVSHPDQVPLDENLIVSHYLNNPMVIDGFKFDVRVYVAVTSYDPLVIYMYEEGLTRFATVKYEKSTKHIRNQCMHLTNYSVNKKSHDYVKNDDPDVEDYGNKWSMGAMLRYLRSMGKDTAALMMRIEDAVIKTLLSVELSIATASKMFMPHRGNCFELYGFDILIDDTLKPWVLEVNLSPSLACDSPLDLKIKGNMLCDLFSLAGIICHDPVVRSFQQQPRKNHDVTAKINSGRAKKLRPQSAGSQAKPGNKSSMTGLNSEEIKILRRVKEEEHRSGGWIRIFPSLDTWDIHGAFLQFNTTHNFMLHQRLYPDRHKIMGMKSPGLSSAARSRSGYLQITGTSHTRLDSEKAIESYTLALIRARQYERKLGSKNRRRKKEVQQKGSRPRLAQGVADEEEEGEHNSDEEDELRGDVKSKQEEAEDKKSNEASEKAPGSGLNQEAISKSTLHETAEIKVQEVKIDALVPSPSAPSPPDPNYSVVDLLLKGHTMSKVQARSAFAMYLVRVQQRLIAEIGPLLQNDVDTLNEQMNLVLRFLKRAAVNLQQTFRVVVPSRKLPLGDRRRILAKQLGDFVHIYNKETEQLREQVKTEKQSKITRETNTEERLDERRFEQFVSIASGLQPQHRPNGVELNVLNIVTVIGLTEMSSEGELEEVLTTYTKLNKSASIFLGSNSTYSVPAKPAHNPVPPPSAQRAEMHLRQYETGDGNQLDNQHGIYSASYTDIRETGNGQPSRPPSASATSYSSALSIYNQKLTRPRSANTYKAPAFFSILDSDKVVKAGSRPISAYGAKTSPFTTSEPVVDTFNEQAIREALHRLAVRQQTRQYSAVNSYSSLKPNFLNPSHNSTHQQTAEISTQLVAHKLPDSHSNSSTDLCYINKEHCQTSYSRVPKNSVDRPPLGKPLPGSGMKDVPASVHMGKAIFGSFVDEFDNDNTHWQTEIASAYSQVTGVEPNNYLTASVNSRQFQLALQHSKQNSDANNQFSQDTTQRRLQEQIMKKQSHTLMEANKAKHHAMVAQAHAAQRSHQCLGGSPLVVVEVEAPLSGFAPKPPVQPAHACSKPTAFHRLTR